MQNEESAIKTWNCNYITENALNLYQRLYSKEIENKSADRLVE